MLARKNKSLFLLVAIFAIVTSTFRSSFEDAADNSIASRHTHSTKYSYSSLQVSSVLYDIEEDAEIESGEEVQELLAVAGAFTQVDFASFRQTESVTAVSLHDDAGRYGYSQPIYLLHRNFRI